MAPGEQHERQEPVVTLDEGEVTFEGGEVKLIRCEDEENSGSAASDSGSQVPVITLGEGEVA